MFAEEVSSEEEVASPAAKRPREDTPRVSGQDVDPAVLLTQSRLDNLICPCGWGENTTKSSAAYYLHVQGRPAQKNRRAKDLCKAAYQDRQFRRTYKSRHEATGAKGIPE